MRKKHVVLRRGGEEDHNGEETNSASSIRRVRYGMCQKNHAAATGGYALDGCREFMATGDDGTDLALVCAACGCHRNFHRMELVHDAHVASLSSPSNYSSSTFA